MLRWLIFLLLLHKNYGQKPNLVLILTDDQDIELYGMYPMSKTRTLIANQGASFTRAFVTTPICCPSRSSILSGRYVHNHGTRNNSISGGCSSIKWQEDIENNHTISTHLHNAGYITFYAGKYLNQYGKRAVGGAEHVPPGWDWWYGLIGNSKYYNYYLSINGTDKKFGDKPKHYLTKVISDKAQKFLRKMSKWHPNRQFFMMLSLPAPHAPFTPESKYQNDFNKVKAPRTASFGQYGKDKHWLIRQATYPINETILPQIDSIYRNRWRTLLTVDDLVENVVKSLNSLGILNNTYIMYTSDNGFHTGQFCLPVDKRQLYEFDVRVPMLLRGPSVTAGSRYDKMVLNIDIAPTLMDLAALPVPVDMDGHSMLHLLRNGTPSKNWRSHFLVEYWGEHNNGIPDTCASLRNRGVAECHPGCVCEDSINNTYACVRSGKIRDNVYCRFEDNEHFVEYYDIRRDPGQLRNIAKKLSIVKRKRLEYKLNKLKSCKGRKCP